MPVNLIRDGLKQPGYRALLFLVLTIGTLLSVILADWTADRLIEQRAASAVSDANILTERLADGITSEIDQNLRYLRGVPVMLSRLASVKAALRDLPTYPGGNLGAMPLQRRAQLGDNTALQELDGMLDGAAQDLGLSLLLVLDPHGICVASSNFLSPVSVAGLDLSDRRYFIGSRDGLPTEDFAIGRATNESGMFFSAPIVDQRHVTGVVAVKVNIEEMAHWISEGNSFVTDRNGVIILAHDPRFLYRALRGAAVFSLTAQQQTGTYKRTHFDVLERTPYTQHGLPTLETLGNLPNPVVIRARTTLQGGLTVYAVTPVTEIARIRVERLSYFWWAFLTYVGMALALLSVAAYYARERRHLRETVALNASLQTVNQDLEHEVRHDPLTGVFNRGHFVKLLGDAIASASNSVAALPSSRFCVAVVDLDFFKPINDTYGHAAGDRALLAFVDVCRAALRASDHFGRIGGEEFAVLLPDADEDIAASVLERMRVQVEQTHISFHQHTLHFTFSAGVTIYESGDQVDGILQRADRALYYAKAHGRNRVVTYAWMLKHSALSV
jgi:diguanylate cyclase (GGDEF)-like protein